MRNSIRLSLVIFIGTVIIQSAEARVAIDSSLLAIFSEVEGRSQRADHQRETAAFISRDLDGGYRCSLWPPTFSWRAEQFGGLVPPGTFAVVHTHPKGLERPSQNDVAECIRTGYIFYVITFWRVYRIDPANGFITAVIRDRDWTRDFRTVRAEERCVRNNQFADGKTRAIKR